MREGIDTSLHADLTLQSFCGILRCNTLIAMLVLSHILDLLSTLTLRLHHPRHNDKRSTEQEKCPREDTAFPPVEVWSITDKLSADWSANQRSDREDAEWQAHANADFERAPSESDLYRWEERDVRSAWWDNIRLLAAVQFDVSF